MAVTLRAEVDHHRRHRRLSRLRVMPAVALAAGADAAADAAALRFWLSTGTIKTERQTNTHGDGKTSRYI
jgi:hypothetical protein